jgi:hypothetical protein
MSYETCISQVFKGFDWIERLVFTYDDDIHIHGFLSVGKLFFHCSFEFILFTEFRFENLTLLNLAHMKDTYNLKTPILAM